MTIQVGDHLPQVAFRVNGPDGPEAKTTDDLFKGRRI
ncbi:MAG TPA: peroxiredoxin, partial [Methylobacterium sp.]